MTALVVAATIILLVAVVFLVAGRLRAAKYNGRLADQLYAIDVNAFRNLIDEDEERYLREHLAPAEFRAVHRERMLAASEYVRGAAHNAGILIRLAETARHDSDATVCAAAERLQENAFRMRLYAWQTLPRLYLAMLLPGMNLAPEGLVERYDNLTRQMVTLTCLQAPARL